MVEINSGRDEKSNTDVIGWMQMEHDAVSKEKAEMERRFEGLKRKMEEAVRKEEGWD